MTLSETVTHGGARNTDVTVIILGGGRGARLDPLTRLRSKPAVPLAGKYRLIDVPISNALHSGMRRIFVLTQFNSVSLHRHIASTYKLGRFSEGFVEVLAAQQTPGNETWFQGTADAVRQNLVFISEQRGTHTLILSGDHLYRLDYNLLLRDHVEHEADVTVAVLPCSEAEIGGFGAVRLDASGRIVEFREKPRTAEARAGMAMTPAQLRERGISPERPYLASMGIYLFRHRSLLSLLDSDAVDFGRHVFPEAVRTRRVHSHVFTGYWRDIGTIRSFYDCHMDLLGYDAPFDFNDPAWVIYTRPRFLPATRMDQVTILRSVVAEGARLMSARIEQSIIGVRSIVRNATIRRTLIMGCDPTYPDATPDVPDVGIGEGTLIEDAIVDKNARIGKEVRIVNEARVQDAEGPGWVVRDGIVVIPKNAVIPDGTVI